MVILPWEKYRGEFGHVQKTLHSWWKKKVAFTITQIDDYLKLIFVNINRKPTTGQTWELKGRGRSLLKKKKLKLEGAVSRLGRQHQDSR